MIYGEIHTSFIFALRKNFYIPAIFITHHKADLHLTNSPGLKNEKT